MAKQKQSSKTKSPKSSKHRRHSKKGTYKVTNWPQYNAALQRRGSLDVWITEEVFDSWEEQLKAVNLGKPGHPFVYPSSFIELVLQLGMVFHQPLRQTEGFTCSILRLLKLPIGRTGLHHAQQTTPQTGRSAQAFIQRYRRSHCRLHRPQVLRRRRVEGQEARSR